MGETVYGAVIAGGGTAFSILKRIGVGETFYSTTT